MNHPSTLVAPKLCEVVEPAGVSRALIELYERFGSAESHDLPMSHTEHALQCGAHAMASRAGETMIAAAFLHDVGHLLALEAAAGSRGMGGSGGGTHEEVGGRFLATWFNDPVVYPVRLHAVAKRFLCAVDVDYRRSLSPPAANELAALGGPMGEQQVADFRTIPHLDAALALTRWDDKARVPGAPVPTLRVFEQLLENVLENQPSRQYGARVRR